MQKLDVENVEFHLNNGQHKFAFQSKIRHKYKL